MIRYRLVCDQSHEFDAWFPTGAAFDVQAGRGQVTCALCGSSKVAKALMAPNVVTRDRGPPPAQAASEHPAPPSFASHVPAEVVELMRQVRKHVLENAENVGDRFAEEARKIHYEEADPRGIYGQATREEAERLLEEGIGFHPLPHLPEDSN